MPEMLLGRIIKACSNAGETVLDPFGGSGTTLVVAKKLSRHFIGFELSKNYAKQIQSRLDSANANDALSGPESPATKAPPTADGRRLGATPKSKIKLAVQPIQEQEDKIDAPRRRKIHST
jgi:DNA methylase